MVISHPLPASSIYYNPWYPPCSIYVSDSLFALSLTVFLHNLCLWLGIVDVKRYVLKVIQQGAALWAESDVKEFFIVVAF